MSSKKLRKKISKQLKETTNLLKYHTSKLSTLMNNLNSYDGDNEFYIAKMKYDIEYARGQLRQVLAKQDQLLKESGVELVQNIIKDGKEIYNV